MHDPFLGFREHARTVSLAISVAGAKLVDDWLAQTQVMPWVMFALSLVVVFLLLEGLSRTFLYAAGHSAIVRRVVFGKYDIEGTWVDLILDGQEAQEVGVTWLEIGDSSVTWSGENHDMHGRSLRAFRTRACIVEWPTMSFWYHDDDPSSGPAEEGVCQITFVERGSSRPDRYTGWGGMVSATKRRRFVGMRIVHADTLRDLADPTKKWETLVALAGMLMAHAHTDAQQVTHKAG